MASINSASVKTGPIVSYCPAAELVSPSSPTAEERTIIRFWILDFRFSIKEWGIDKFSLFSERPIPDSRFPIPDSRFPIPDSLNNIQPDGILKLARFSWDNFAALSPQTFASNESSRESNGCDRDKAISSPWSRLIVKSKSANPTAAKNSAVFCRHTQTQMGVQRHPQRVANSLARSPLPHKTPAKPHTSSPEMPDVIATGGENAKIPQTALVTPPPRAIADLPATRGINRVSAIAGLPGNQNRPAKTGKIPLAISANTAAIPAILPPWMKAADTPTLPVPSALKSRRVNTRTAHPVSGKAPRAKLVANSKAIDNSIKLALYFQSLSIMTSIYALFQSSDILHERQ